MVEIREVARSIGGQQSERLRQLRTDLFDLLHLDSRWAVYAYLCLAEVFPPRKCRRRELLASLVRTQYRMSALHHPALQRRIEVGRFSSARRRHACATCPGTCAAILPLPIFSSPFTTSIILPGPSAMPKSFRIFGAKRGAACSESPALLAPSPMIFAAQMPATLHARISTTCQHHHADPGVVDDAACCLWRSGLLNAMLVECGRTARAVQARGVWWGRRSAGAGLHR